MLNSGLSIHSSTSANNVCSTYCVVSDSCCKCKNTAMVNANSSMVHFNILDPRCWINVGVREFDVWSNVRCSFVGVVSGRTDPPARVVRVGGVINA